MVYREFVLIVSILIVTVPLVLTNHLSEPGLWVESKVIIYILILVFII